MSKLGKTLGTTIALSLCMSLLRADAPEMQLASIAQNSYGAKKQGIPEQKTAEVPAPKPCVNKSKYYFYGDVLYWQAAEGGLPLAIDNYNSINGTVLNHGKVKNMEFGWDLGFRIGFDAKLGENGWDLNASWLRFEADAHRGPDAHDTTHQFYPTQTHPADAFYSLGTNAAQMNYLALAYYINNGTNNSYSRVEADWDCDLNQIDVDLGRVFNPAKWLTLRPHFGVRTTRIEQKLKVAYKYNNAVSQIFQLDPILPVGNPLLFDLEQFQSPGDDFTVRKKNDWWGLGPEVGLDTTWNLGCGWGLFGNVTAAIEYGFHKTRDKDEDTTLDKENINVSSTFRTSHPILDLQLGLSWTKLFCNRYSLALTGMWEHHVYFSQNQFPFFVDSKSLGTFTTNNSDLTYQGFTFSFQFGF